MIALIVQLLMFISPAISAATIGLKYDEVKHAGTSAAWPATKGTIDTSQILPTGKKYKGQPLYYTEIQLNYEADQKPYSITLRPSDDQGLREGPKQWARQLAINYKPESEIRLYYNPQKPKQATLAPGHTEVDASRWLILGTLMLIFSFILHLLSVLALTPRFLTISTISTVILATITFIVMLIIGALIFLIAQGMREQAPAT